MTALRLIAYTPNGASLGPLPESESHQAQFVLNDVGALTIAYPPNAARAEVLALAPLEVAAEVSWDGGLTWSEPRNARFLYLREGRDPIKTEDAFAIEAPSYIKRLEKALVGTANLTVEGGQREFVTQTPGAILTALWDEAQGRGALSGMTRTWSATQDSAGTPWPESFSITYDPGGNLLAVLSTMAESGWVDFATQGRSVQVYVAEHPSGLAADRTTGALPVTLRFGRDLTEAPFRRTWEGLADTALVLGDNGARVTRVNPAALKPWGVQETFVTASGVEDPGTLSTLGDAALTFTEDARAEHTFGLEFGATPHLPFRDYQSGEWVQAATSGTVAPSRMRVRSITLTRDADGSTGGNVVLNDRFLEADVLQNRRVQRILAGATQSGTGGTPSPTGPDILAPAKVTGLGASSAAYVEPVEGRVRSQITLNWNDTTTNADGTPTSDVASYEVWGRVPGFGDWDWVGAATQSAWFRSDYEPGLTWEFQVRAVDTSGNKGLLSDTASTTTAADLTPPPKPSAPTGTTRMGTARISWDGLTATGTSMAGTVADFRYVAVHVSQVNNFTPSDATRVDELSAPGYVVAGPLNYQSTYYARLVAYDSSGNASIASDQVTLVVAPLVDVSNFPDDAMEALYARTGQFLNLSADNFSANLIEGAWVKAGALSADKLTIGTGGQSVTVNGYMEDLNDAGTLPRNWVVGYQNGTAATLSLETAAPLSGRRSLRMTVPANCGASWMNVLPSPGYLPVVAGQVWYVRALVKASRALPTSRFAVRFATSKAPSNPDGIFDANVVWQYADTTVGTGTTLVEAQFTVPTDHTRMQPGFNVNGDPGGAYDLVVDSIEFWPAATDSQITSVGAGKIRTGVLQATERVVAGSLTGARAELNGVGFQAFNPSSIKMFEVEANSGDTYIGDKSAVHIKMGAYGNPWGQAYSQGMLEFRYAGSGWGPGRMIGHYWADSGLNWGAVRISSPYNSGLGAGQANSAYLDLRNEAGGHSQFYLEAKEANFTANTYIMGSSGAASTVDFRLGVGALGWTFTDYSSTSRLNIYNDVGQVRLRSGNAAGGVQNMVLNANEVQFLSGSHTIYYHISNADPGMHHFGRNVGLAWGFDRLRSTTYNNDVWMPFAGSAFVVGSDPRLKSNATKVGKGALAAMRSVQVYDYDMEGILPRKSSRSDRTEPQRPKANRARGVMADELQAVLPDAVNADEDGRLGVSLYDLTATLMAAIQELADEVDTLRGTPAPTRK